jgi:hypothetical protein
VDVLSGFAPMCCRAFRYSPGKPRYIRIVFEFGHLRILGMLGQVANLLANRFEPLSVLHMAHLAQWIFGAAGLDDAGFDADLFPEAIPVVPVESPLFTAELGAGRLQHLVGGGDLGLDGFLLAPLQE